jgi:hypothetical protein
VLRRTRLLARVCVRATCKKDHEQISRDLEDSGFSIFLYLTRALNFQQRFPIRHRFAEELKQ